MGANGANAAALGMAVAAAITSSITGFQPFFVLAFSFLAARLIPSAYSFTLTRREILYKIFCFAVMLGGLVLVVGTSGE